MNRLSTRNRMLVGLTLFSMFFGAGNLIFPPYLGAMAGTKTPLAMLGFAITAIGFPILGVIAVAHAGSLDELAGRVHPVFAKVLLCSSTSPSAPVWLSPVLPALPLKWL